MHIGVPVVTKQSFERLCVQAFFSPVNIKLIRQVAVQIEREEACETLKMHHKVQNKLQLTEPELTQPDCSLGVGERGEGIDWTDRPGATAETKSQLRGRDRGGNSLSAKQCSAGMYSRLFAHVT